MSNKS